MSYEINERLVLLTGWKQALEDGPDTWTPPEGIEWDRSGIPDYSGDLNEIHKLEMSLMISIWPRYTQALKAICDWETGFTPIAATAEQRARAMIETLETP